MASSFFLFIFLSAIFALFSISHSSMLIPLTHSLSTANATVNAHDHLKATAARSQARFRRHRRQVSIPLTPGADYTLSFSIGSQTISLYMDTGSDVVWLPCQPFECILCDGKYSPAAVPFPGPLNLTSASASHCKSPACSAVHSGLASSDLCAMAKCPLESIEMDECQSFACPPFYYAYGDGSFVARLYQDTLAVPKAAAALELRNFTFGCANSALGEPIGVAGFGRGELSLPAQLASTAPEIGNYFSYCLISHSFDKLRAGKPSPLILGRYDRKAKTDIPETQEFVYYSYTPMLDNPKHKYFYCVGLEAVSIGIRRIPAPDSLRRIDRNGDGGMVVDSGTTFTMLPQKFYQTVVAEFNRRVGAVYRRARAVEDRTGMGPCYYGNSAAEKFGGKVPKWVMHFGRNASVVMPRRNYFHEFLDGDQKLTVGCLMVMDGGAVEEKGSGGGPAGVLGNYQQQGFEVVYDLEAKRVGFARRKCASLWDRLS